MRTIEIDMPLHTKRTQIADILADLLNLTPNTVQCRLHPVKPEGLKKPIAYVYPYSMDAVLMVNLVNIDGEPSKISEADKEVILWKMKNPTRRALPKALREKMQERRQMAKLVKKANASGKPIVIIRR